MVLRNAMEFLRRYVTASLAIKGPRKCLQLMMFATW
jgi:hypothetical protein